MTADADITTIQCNYAVATKIATLGARCYLLQWQGWPNRVRILVRSRSGRWIVKWEAIWRLHDFRFKTIPLEHPLRDRFWDMSDEYPERMNQLANEARGGQLAHLAGLTAPSVERSR